MAVFGTLPAIDFSRHAPSNGFSKFQVLSRLRTVGRPKSDDQGYNRLAAVLSAGRDQSVHCVSNFESHDYIFVRIPMGVIQQHEIIWPQSTQFSSPPCRLGQVNRRERWRSYASP